MIDYNGLSYTCSTDYLPSRLQHLLSLGLRVFPLTDNTKRPDLNLCANFSKDASNNPDTILTWYAQSTTKNWGVVADGLVIIDVDMDGLKEFKALVKQHGLPTTYSVATPSGGYHYYFRYVGGKIGQKDLIHGVNVRSGNGYVVATGEIDNQSYKIISDNVIATLPEWLVNLLENKTKRHKINRAPTSHQLTGEYVSYDFTGSDKTSLKKLSFCLRKIKMAKEGLREATTRTYSYQIGQLIAAGRVKEKEARETLVHASICSGLPANEAYRAVERGIREGKKNPEASRQASKASQEAKILEAIDNGYATVKDIVSHTKMSASTVERRITQLVESQILTFSMRHTGKKPIRIISRFVLPSAQIDGNLMPEMNELVGVENGMLDMRRESPRGSSKRGNPVRERSLHNSSSSLYSLSLSH